MADHDHAYKLLFSHPEMVRDLLEGFLNEEWLNELDYECRDALSSSSAELRYGAPGLIRSRDG